MRDQVLHNDFIILPEIDMHEKVLIALVIDTETWVHVRINTVTHIKTKAVLPQERFRLMEPRLQNI